MRKIKNPPLKKLVGLTIASISLDNSILLSDGSRIRPFSVELVKSTEAAGRSRVNKHALIKELPGVHMTKVAKTDDPGDGYDVTLSNGYTMHVFPALFTKTNAPAPSKLKKWNGRAPGSRSGAAYIAAYSQKQAREILEAAFKTRVSANEISKYFSPCWGNPMQDFAEPIKPCVFYRKSHIGTPVKIYSL